MPVVSISVCEACGSTFILSEDEIKILATMKPKIRKQNAAPRPIKTWEDWMLHISTHCPACRFEQPPLQAVESLESHKESTEKYIK